MFFDMMPSFCNIFFACYCTLSYFEEMKSGYVCKISDFFIGTIFYFLKLTLLLLYQISCLLYLIVMLCHVMIFSNQF